MGRMPWDLRAWHDRLERLSVPHPDGWAPAIDVYETAAAYVVIAEIPGVTRDQFDLALDDTRLTLRGDRAAQRAGGDVQHYHQIERSYGSFARTFEFPHTIDVERVTADLRDGVLTVTLPKVPPPSPRRIPIQ
jgi:HSP20 family protein